MLRGMGRRVVSSSVERDGEVVSSSVERDGEAGCIKQC